MKVFRDSLWRGLKGLVPVFLIVPVALAAESESGRDAKQVALQSYAVMPLAFEPNLGQANSDARYIARSQSLSLLIKDKEATLLLPNSADRAKVSPFSMINMQFVGARFAGRPSASERHQGISNYLLGAVAADWHAGVPNFGRVKYPGLYPGVDLVFYGNHHQLEHDFVVAPGADYRQIRVCLEGANHVALVNDGSLLVTTESGDLTFRAPEIYQYKKGRRVPISGSYILAGANEFRFQVSDYDHTLPLVIDPILTYSTYLAGSSADSGTAIAVDSSGNAYITGYTFSSDFPLQNPLQATCSNSCFQTEAFVTKFNPTGSALVYSTYVGGNDYDQGSAIAVDSVGNTLVSGSTSSFDFPQKNGLGVVLGYGSTHGFAFSLNAMGSDFNFSTYLGGQSYDSATGISSDATGNVYVSGYTSSQNFPVTPGNQIGPPPGYSSNDLFLAKFTSNGALVFSTLIGGSGYTFSYQTNPISLAVNSGGEALLTGAAQDGFPTTPGSYQPNYPGVGATSAFLGLLNNTGSAFRYATYLGGTGALGGDAATHVAMDSVGNVYVTGTTASLDFPTTPGAFQTTNLQAGPISFVTKMDPTLSTLLFSTYLGGTQSVYGNGVSATGIALDSNGNSYIIGNTNESVFPLVNPLVGAPPQTIWGPGNTAFLSVLDASGSVLTFSTFFTGTIGTFGTAVAVDVAGNPYITGTTYDADLPTTAGAFQPTIPVPPYPGQHAFLTKFSLNAPNAGACLSTSSLYFPPTEPGKSSYPLPVTLTNCGTLTLKISSTVISNSVFVLGQNGCTRIAPGASCTVKVRYSPILANGTDIGALQFSDNAPITPQTVQLSGYSAWPSITIYSSGLFAPDEIVGLTSDPLLTTALTYGPLPLHITSVTATGDFTGVNQCPKVLQPGQQCSLGATFTPTAEGPRTGTLYIYDDAPDSPQTLSLSGNGLSVYPTPTITNLYPSAVQVGSGPVFLFINGNEIFPTTTVTVNGKSVQSRTVYPGTLEATLPSGFFTKVGSLSVQIVNPAPGGASPPVGVAVYSQITVGAADIVYEPFTQKYYASIPSTSVNNPNTLVTIDPVTGVIGTPIPIGNNPGALGLSTDGTILYVGLNGDNSIIPFNLLTRSAGTPIPLGSDPLKGAFTAATLQVQPNHADSFIATLNAGYYGADGIDWIQNGTIVSQFLNEPPNNVSVGGTRFVGSANVYGWSPYYGSTGIHHFVITGKGLLEASGITGNFGLGALDTDGTNLYDVNGQIFNAATGTVVGTFVEIYNYTPASAVFTDTSSGRTFFFSQYNGLLAFDSATFAEVGTINSLSVNSPPNRLQHWGPDGLSFLTYDYSTNAYNMILLRSNLFYPASGPNPRPIAKSVNPATVTSQGPNFLLAVSGSKFIQGAAVLWNGSSRTTRWVSSSQLVADIPASDIATPGTVHITVLNPMPGGGKSGAVSLTIK